MGIYKTDQENFWAGEFGDDYLTRNQSQQLRASNLALFSKIISNTKKISSAIEFGANIGLNLRTLKQLFSEIDLAAVEINNAAVEKLKKIDGVRIYNRSIHDFFFFFLYDFVFT